MTDTKIKEITERLDRIEKALMLHAEEIDKIEERRRKFLIDVVAPPVFGVLIGILLIVFFG